MAISPPSDIVLDVVRAADPARRQAAAERLAGLAAAKGTSPSQFGSLMDAMPAADTSASCAPPRAFPGGLSATGDKAPEAYKAFEAFLLQSFIQSMLPKESAATYGSGTAGHMWRSMTAEHIGNEIADAGGIGIADRLLMESAKAESRQPREPGSAFSLASNDGAFRDWSSYLPFLDSGYANGILSAPARLPAISDGI